MKLVATIIMLTACSREARLDALDDCTVVRDHPARAAAELSKRHPNTPAHVVETIERCAPQGGGECKRTQRIAKIVTASPHLAPQLPKAVEFDYVKTCRESSAKQRRCLLPSYALGHADECRRARQALLANPIMVSAREYELPDDCGLTVTLFVAEHGVWLATGTDDKGRCYAPRNAGALDRNWLMARLRATKTNACTPNVELAAAPTVLFGEMKDVQSTARDAGLGYVNLVPVADLAVPLAAADPAGASRTCPPATNVTHASASDSPAPTDDPLQNSLTIDITHDDILVNARRVATVADAKAGTGELASLRAALPSGRAGLPMLSADKRTPAGVIDRVVKTAKAAGHDRFWW